MASAWTVTEFVRGKRFVWETRRLGLRMSASHEVMAERVGTANRLRVEMSGVLAVLLGPVLRRAVGRALSAENEGLKGRCEELMEAKARL